MSLEKKRFLNAEGLTSKLAALALAIIILLAPAMTLANVPGFFLTQIKPSEWQNLADAGITKENGKILFNQITEYVNFRSNTVDQKKLSREDIIHLKDVRLLTGRIYTTIAISTFVVATITFSLRGKKRKILADSAKFVAGIVVTACVLAFFFFDELFIKFHEIFFANDYWLLDSRTSNLIKFLPQSSFERYFTASITISLIISLSLFTLSRFGNKFARVSTK